VRRIGVLMDGAATEADFLSELAAFVEGLRLLGWNPGQNLRMDVRYSGTAGRHTLCLQRCTALILLGFSSLRIN